MDINKKIDLFKNFWYKSNKMKKIYKVICSFIIAAFFVTLGYAQVGTTPASEKEQINQPTAVDIQKAYKTSFAYYLKRVAQGAPIQEKIAILEKIIKKYNETEVDLDRVNSELSKLKKQLPASESKESKTSPQVVLSEQQNLEMKRRERAIAEKTKELLESTLKKYYPKDNFIVTVGVSLEKISPEKISKEPEIEGEIFEKGTVEMPGLPVTSSPVLTEEEKNQEPQIATSWEQILRIKWMKISILLKEGQFKQNDKDFIASVVKMKSEYDENRGDILSIQELPFPPVQEALASELAEPVKPATPVFSLKDYAGWVLSAILFVVAISLFSSLSKAKREARQPIIMPQVPPTTISREESVPSSPEKVKDNGMKKLLEEVRELMITTLIGNPELSTKVIKNWVDTDKEEGLNRASILIKTTDARMVDTLLSELGPDLGSQLSYTVSTQTGEVEKEALENIYRKFKDDYAKELQNEIREHGLSKEKDIFIFLRKLEPHQVLNILQDEPPGVIAVGLAQLSPEVSSQILRELPEDKRIKVPLEMGKLKKVPATAYYDIADKLSRKALGVANIRYVSTDGTEVLVNILENLDFDTEQEVLSKIKQQDLALANEIRKIYISLPDIINLSNRFLADILRTINQETVTKMLVGINPELKDKILNNLPARVKTIVQDSIDQYKDISPIEIVKSQREFLAEIRNLAKTGKVNLVRVLDEGEAEKLALRQAKEQQTREQASKEAAKT